MPTGPDQSDQREDEPRGERARQAGTLLGDGLRLLAQRRVEGDARALEQLEGRFTARHDEDVVVLERYPLGPLAVQAGPIDLELDDCLVDGEYPAPEDQLELAALEALREALLVPAANAEERLLAVGERHAGAGLLREGHCGLDGAVATADDENATVLIGVGVDEAVRDLREVFARYADLAR